MFFAPEENLIDSEEIKSKKPWRIRWNASQGVILRAVLAVLMAVTETDNIMA